MLYLWYKFFMTFSREGWQPTLNKWPISLDLVAQFRIKENALRGTFRSLRSCISLIWTFSQENCSRPSRFDCHKKTSSYKCNTLSSGCSSSLSDSKRSSSMFKAAVWSSIGGNCSSSLLLGNWFLCSLLVGRSLSSRGDGRRCLNAEENNCESFVVGRLFWAVATDDVLSTLLV